MLNNITNENYDFLNLKTSIQDNLQNIENTYSMNG